MERAFVIIQTVTVIGCAILIGWGLLVQEYVSIILLSCTAVLTASLHKLL